MSNKKKTLLGMSFGKANNRLLKSILFDFIIKCGRDTCYRCSTKIESVSEMSIEHMTAWQREPDPIVAFFDLDNIAFSHRTCNCAASFKPHKRYATDLERASAYYYRVGNVKRQTQEWREKSNAKRAKSRAKKRMESSIVLPDIPSGPLLIKTL